MTVYIYNFKHVGNDFALLFAGKKFLQNIFVFCSFYKHGRQLS